METFELVTLKSGIISLRSTLNKETFHPVTGPAIEAQILHVDQQRLLERAALNSPFIIWDVGLGASANAIAVLKSFQNRNFEDRDLQDLAPSVGAAPVTVELYSFDKTLAPLRFALQNSKALQYLAGFEDVIERLVQKRVVQVSSQLSWKFIERDFANSLSGLDVPAPHAIIYDPYSSVNNPEMWTVEHFRRLFLKLDPKRPCLLTNYTRSTAVRVALLLAGFYVGVGRAVGEKAETTIASNSLSLLEKPLDRSWLERVKVSRNAEPLRAASFSKSYQAMSAGHQGISSEDYARLESSVHYLSRVE